MATGLLIHPPLRGLQWLRDALWLFGRQPVSLAGLPAFFMLALVLVSLVPVLGAWVGFMAMPLLGQAFVQATYRVREGGRVQLTILWEPLQNAERRRDLIRMGLVHAAGLMVTALITQWVDGGAMARVVDVMTNDASTNAQLQEALAQPALYWSMVTQMALWSVWATVFCFVPALILWQRQTLAQAVFSNLLGLWRNKAPLTVFVLAYALLTTAAMLMLMLALQLGGANLMVFLALMLSLPMTAVFYLGLGAMYRDSFVARPAPVASDPQTPAALE